ncbi:bifunctional oligoribonuclease/PAP phosphatase NrnA [Mechercharimyces sp. CAU 1602]|uniref:DHH family phosphoesterase n=1 Tax=Mechercharimyces sp. CAU 1602 TaxID=2973933 RepID=UPI0021633543|nr:bifunctional oligoribonuclease/PAP phosphatase NrnA [Mechercharimyces sp. CAU 1602]
MEPLSAATRFLNEANRFLVISHVDPDGDAIGSTLAVGEVLQQLGKEVQMVNESVLPRKFRFLAGSERIGSPEEVDIERFSHVITVDAADIRRIGSLHTALAPDTAILNIDHHGTNDHFGTMNWVVADAAATTQVLYEWIENLPVSWTPSLATSVYTGLFTDTGGFRYSNTSEDVMQIAAKLLAHGAPAHQVAEEVMETVSRSHLHLLQQALSSLSFAHNDQIAWMVLSGEWVHEQKDEVEGIVNYARNVEGVEVGILFREVKSQVWKVSLRSREHVDVSRVATSFDGGGHARAAGCTVIGSEKEVTMRVVSLVKELLAGEEIV